MKKFLTVLVCIFLLVPKWVLCAEESEYHLYDSTEKGLIEVDRFTTFSSAYQNYLNLQDDYDNLVLTQNDEVILMEYGIVEFLVNDGCTLNIDYSDANGDSYAINGCYGIDAAYLGVSDGLETIRFLISGKEGFIARENVVLHPYETLDVSISNYDIANGHLYHNIKSQLDEDYYFTSIDLYLAPEYLDDAGMYYSYDGHYFYDDFYSMIDDYRSDQRINAVNQDAAYYNYYMYLPHRSLTNYDYSDVEDYFYDTLNFNKRLDGYYDFNYDNANDDVNRSQYVDNIAPFFEYQYLYGANALMMLSLSINESSYGKSKSAYDQNNLFGHAAYDNEEDIANNRYQNVAASIYSHAKYYISSRFASPVSGVYNGSFFGDKASGMGVNYSNDPYWGEKLAAYYNDLDEALGLKDYNSYALGIIEDEGEITFYGDSDLEEAIFKIEDVVPYSFIIIEEGDDYYKIQFDGAMDLDNYLYDFENDVAYVKKDATDVVLNPEKIIESDYHTVTFEFKEKKISYLIKEGMIPIISKPQQEAMEFTGFDKELKPVLEDVTYTAQYRKVKGIEMNSYPQDKMRIDGELSLVGAKIDVTYEDDEGLTYKETLPVNTDMVTAYDLSEYGKQDIIVSYAGFVTSFPIEVSETITAHQEIVEEMIAKIDSNSAEDTSVNEINLLRDYIIETGYRLSNEEIVRLDAILLQKYDGLINFHISSPYPLAISGMALTLDVSDSYDQGIRLYTDTYYLTYGVIDLIDQAYLEKISSGYGFEQVFSFSLHFNKNSTEVKPQLPYIIEIKFDDLDTHKVYSVYSIDDEGDVIKCRTSQSTDGIQFSTRVDGNFMVLALDSKNDYVLDSDVHFNLTMDNDDIDLNNIVFVVSWFVIIILLNGIALVSYRIGKERREKLWNDYKKSWHNAE